MGTAEHGTDQALHNGLCPAMADLPMRGVTQAMTTFVSWLEERQNLPKIGAQPPAAAPGHGLGQPWQLLSV